jgi:hypothetical protein
MKRWLVRYSHCATTRASRAGTGALCDVLLGDDHAHVNALVRSRVITLHAHHTQRGALRHVLAVGAQRGAHRAHDVSHRCRAARRENDRAGDAERVLCGVHDIGCVCVCLRSHCLLHYILSSPGYATVSVHHAPHCQPCRLLRPSLRSRRSRRT